MSSSEFHTGRLQRLDWEFKNAKDLQNQLIEAGYKPFHYIRDGTISFATHFYNGGTSFEEQIEEILEGRGNTLYEKR